MFSISEEGDLFIHEDGTFTDISISNPVETEFRIARSRVLSSFKHRNFLSEQFIKSHRNTYADDEINKKITEQLDKIFDDKKQLRQKIIFLFDNEESKFTILFLYQESKNVNRNLLIHSVYC